MENWLTKASMKSICTVHQCRIRGDVNESRCITTYPSPFLCAPLYLESIALFTESRIFGILTGIRFASRLTAALEFSLAEYFTRCFAEGNLEISRKGENKIETIYQF
jgi:hypothetical protein